MPHGSLTPGARTRASMIRSSLPQAPAIIEFRGFPPGPLGAPPRVVLLAHSGDPVPAARWFKEALARAGEPRQFAVACLRIAPAPYGPPEGQMVDQSGAYRYRLALASGVRAGVRLQCWRCYGEGIGWQRRCGPMSLGAFVAHFEAMEGRGSQAPS